ncbi:PP2C family protein-serine/threonine phosphatase [Saccharothrix saharensis]|uniref:PP2C family protein-serine/threonine phosphatase n=1 Tax=Saccharothrix saharensis TaxID=571190 RepID=UPI00369B3E32
MTTPVQVGVATSRGPNRPLNADAHARHCYRGTFAAAVVDGTGSTPEVADFAHVAASVAARVAARETPVLGVVAAAAPYAEDEDGPSGAIVVASVRRDGYWRIAHAGDSTAYGLRDDGTVRRFTTPHTLGEEMRQQGVPDAEATAHDHKLRHDLGRVPLYGVEGFEAIADLLVLASDGLKVPHEELERLLATHGHHPQRCAEELVAAARAHGSRDDVTVLVIPHPDRPATTQPMDERSDDEPRRPEGPAGPAEPAGGRESDAGVPEGAAEVVA